MGKSALTGTWTITVPYRSGHEMQAPSFLRHCCLVEVRGQSEGAQVAQCQYLFYKPVFRAAQGFVERQKGKTKEAAGASLSIDLGLCCSSGACSGASYLPVVWDCVVLSCVILTIGAYACGTLASLTNLSAMVDQPMMGICPFSSELPP